MGRPLGRTLSCTSWLCIDRRLHLVDEPPFGDNEYTPNIDRITPAMLGLSALLERRRPPAGLTPAQLSGWTYRSEHDGHTHYLIIDDVDGPTFLQLVNPAAAAVAAPVVTAVVPPAVEAVSLQTAVADRCQVAGRFGR